MSSTGEWINIEEIGFPPQRKHVILYWSGLKEMYIGYYQGKSWYSASSKIRFWAIPDFYMPLPAPPKTITDKEK